MTADSSPRFILIDRHPESTHLREEALAGLTSTPKFLPAKLFYDTAGSALFEEITQQPEYYLTNAELSILSKHGEDIARQIGPGAIVIEYGSGNSRKICTLLDRLPQVRAYVPVDISREFLAQAADHITKRYPTLSVIAICSDYTKPLELPVEASTSPRVVVFLGSSIGNFEPLSAVQFLRDASQPLGPGDGLLIGVDLKKSPHLLDRAYNDGRGVTAAFNQNILKRLNHELGASFHLESFQHRAFYNPRQGRVEMHLISLVPQTVQVAGVDIALAQRETIHTENSYKYTVDELHHLALLAGLNPRATWVDSDRQFSLHYLAVQAN